MIKRIIKFFSGRIDTHKCKMIKAGVIYQCPICKNSRIVWNDRK